MCVWTPTERDARRNQTDGRPSSARTSCSTYHTSAVVTTRGTGASCEGRGEGGVGGVRRVLVPVLLLTPVVQHATETLRARGGFPSGRAVGGSVGAKGGCGSGRAVGGSMGANGGCGGVGEKGWSNLR